MSIMVEGVQVTLPSYDEAVSSGGASASALGPESRVQIVLSEGQHAAASEAGPSRASPLKQQRSETAAARSTPPSPSSPAPSSSSAWVLERAVAAASSLQRRASAGSEQHGLSLDSEMDDTDGKARVLHSPAVESGPLANADLCVAYRCATTEADMKPVAAFVWTWPRQAA